MDSAAVAATSVMDLESRSPLTSSDFFFWWLDSPKFTLPGVHRAG